MKTIADLSFFEGEPGHEHDPDKAHARIRARSELWDELARCGIECDAFDSWLAVRLRAFHGAKHVQSQFPEPAEEIQWLQRLQPLLRQVAQLSKFGAAPPRAHNALNAEAIRADVDLHAIRERLQADLTVLEVLAAVAARRLQRAPVRRGRRADVERDSLLADVVAELRGRDISATVAGVLALKVLQAEGIGAPSPAQKAPEKAAARSARRVQK